MNMQQLQFERNFPSFLLTESIRKEKKWFTFCS